MKFAKIQATILCLACSAPVPSLLSASGLKYALPGAKANAMGTAFSSVADDPWALYYNPAGLSLIKRNRFGAEIARRFSPLHPAGEISAVFVRPQPDRTNAVAAVGYHAFRQGELGKKDSLAVGYSGIKTIKYFQKPVRWGFSGKILRYYESGESSIGLGAGAGILMESEGGLNTSLVLSDLTVGMPESMLTFTLGNSYRLGNYVFAMDFKITSGHSEFFPGVEKSVLNDLVRIRLGKGFSTNGKDFLSAGLGFNALPYIINASFSVPWSGLGEKAGRFSIGVSYRLGEETYADRFVGNAAEKARNLQSEINALRTSKARLKTETATMEVNKNILSSEVTMLRSRQVELEDTLRKLQIEIANAQYRKKEPKKVQVKRITKKKGPQWPRKYTVRKGDTLRSIASKFYGNPGFWETIYEANEDKIFRGLPVEGSKLTIPPPPK